MLIGCLGECVKIELSSDRQTAVSHHLNIAPFIGGSAHPFRQLHPTPPILTRPLSLLQHKSVGI